MERREFLKLLSAAAVATAGVVVPAAVFTAQPQHVERALHVNACTPWFQGDRDPSDKVTAAAGALYIRMSRGNHELYINTSVSVGTDWTQL